MGILLLYRVGINKNALIYSSYNAAREMLLLPTHSECQTQAFLGFGHGLFVHSSDQDVIEYYYRRPAGGGGGGSNWKGGSVWSVRPDRVLFISPKFVFTI